MKTDSDSNPQLIPLDVYCKICGRPFVTWYDKDCPSEWVQKLSPLVCCDGCYDRREAAVRRDDQARTEAALERIRKVVKPSEEEETRRETLLRKNNQHWYEKL